MSFDLLKPECITSELFLTFGLDLMSVLHGLVPNLHIHVH